MSTIIDITHPLHPALAVWPGDTPYSHRWVMQMASGDGVNVSTLTLSAHTGTHADAPLHFIPNGAPIGTRSLAAYLGAAQVVDIPNTGPIHPAALSSLTITAPRLLLRTPSSQRSNTEWYDDIAYPTPATVDFLADQGVVLLGTDAPSVDPIHSKTLDAHHRLAHHNMAILENLALAYVEPGRYELIALPLALPIDGSPVRAILRTLI
ncbi:MAG: arylformamidase [Litorilinea sp.]